MEMCLYLRKVDYANDFISEDNECNYPKDLEWFENQIIKSNQREIKRETFYRVAYWKDYEALHKIISGECPMFPTTPKEQTIFLTKKDIDVSIKWLNFFLTKENKKSLFVPTDKTYDEYYLAYAPYTLNVFEHLSQFLSDNPDYEIVYQVSC